jgi:hypothetical protein
MKDEGDEQIEDDLVPVMVPKRLLSAVYGFIAAQAQLPTSATPSGTLHKGWTEPMIVEAYTAASDRMRGLLDLLASRPDEKLYVEDFMDALGADKPDFVNGVLGAFGRLTNQRFASRLPNNKNTWPFTVSKDIRRGRWSYVMPQSVANVVKAIGR